MTYNLAAPWSIECDHPRGCAAFYDAGAVCSTREARSEAGAHGWQVNVPARYGRRRLDYCPDHRPDPVTPGEAAAHAAPDRACEARISSQDGTREFECDRPRAKGRAHVWHRARGVSAWRTGDEYATTDPRRPWLLVGHPSLTSTRRPAEPDATQAAPARTTGRSTVTTRPTLSVASPTSLPRN